MQNRHQGFTRISWPCLTGPSLKHGVSVIALAFTLNTPLLALAQDINPVVDLTDPYVSVDLSVLNDGGLTPYASTPISASSAGALPSGTTAYQAPGYQAPGKDMPVSTLYIKPTSGFNLPPQTKAIETKSTPAQMAKADIPAPIATPVAVPAIPAVTPPPTAITEDVTVESVLKAVPEAVEVAKMPTPPIAAPVQSPVVEAAPQPVQEEVAATPPPPPPPISAPEPAVEVQPVTADEPESKPESTPVALDADTTSAPPPPPAATPEPTPAPIAAPAEEVAALSPPKAQEMTPPPPPQAVPEPTPAVAPAPAVVEHDETQTAPKAKSNEVVLPLPPKDEVASLPPAAGPLNDGDSMRIVFDADSSKLPQTARDALLEMATKMSSQAALRLQLLAYAGTADTSASAARRLSLSRALAVRSFLIENGVRSTRIDVRALGNKSTEDITERVDITVVER